MASLKDFSTKFQMTTEFTQEKILEVCLLMNLGLMKRQLITN